MECVFPLILGQCAPTIRDCVEESKEWSELNSISDVIGLLGVVQISLYQKSTQKHNVHSFLDAKAALHTFRQDQNMTNSKYKDKIMSLIELYKDLGGKPGCSAFYIARHLPVQVDGSPGTIKEASKANIKTAKSAA